LQLPEATRHCTAVYEALFKCLNPNTLFQNQRNCSAKQNNSSVSPDSELLREQEFWGYKSLKILERCRIAF
jgi:hypothetical protein